MAEVVCFGKVPWFAKMEEMDTMEEMLEEGKRKVGQEAKRLYD